MARRDRRARRRRRPRLDPAAAAGPRHREGLRAGGHRAGRPRPGRDQRGVRRGRPASTKELGLDADKVNVNGGAIALGHPIGMSGARLVLHLALELKRRGGGVGAAALCGGGGQGDALIVRGSPRRPETGLAVAAVTSRRTRRRPRPGRVGQGRAVPRAVGAADLARRGRAPALREVMAALAPHTGDAHVVGLTGSPGVGKSTSTSALVGAFRGAGSGSGCSPSTRPRRSPAARCSATGSGCRSTPSTPASTSARWPRAATSADSPGRRRRRCASSTRPAATSCSSRRSASGSPRSRSPVSPTPRSCCSRPAWATASRRPRPASSRSATSSSSTRPTATAPTRRSATCGT